MCGIIDAHGQQWEHCNGCNAWTKLEELFYEPKTEAHPYGRDLCEQCVLALTHEGTCKIIPPWMGTSVRVTCG